MASSSNNSAPEEAAAAGAGGKSWVDVVKTDENENSDATHGFTRPEMLKKKALVGSVDLYERHVFLRWNQPASWPSKVEAAGYDPLPSKMVNALRSKKNELAKKTRLTIADGQEEPEKTNGDILVFPDMIKYKGIAESDIESFVDEVLVKGEMWALGEPESLVGSHVFICAHGSRDKRCGVCGPPLKECFEKEIALRGLSEQVFVNFCSHIGGHKYAGNVIVFRHEKNSGDVSGHWYGYVTPEDVPEILEKHIGLGQVVDRLWRGQMGLTEEQQKDVQQKRSPGMEKPPAGAEHEKADKPKRNKILATTTSNGESVLEKVTTSAPRKPIHTLLPRIGSRDLHQMCGDETMEEQGPLKPYAEKKKPRFKLPVWIEDWETGDTIAVVSLATAVAGIYLAYNVYQRSQHQS